MLLAARLVLVLAIGGWHLIGERALEFGPGLALHLTATFAFLVLVRGVVRGSYRPGLGEALGLSLLLRVLVLPLAPAFSDDIYRYLFEGRLVTEGINPYLTAPLSPLGAFLHGPTWHLINHPEIPAAYPPAMQGALAIGARISEGALGMKLVFGGFDLLTFVALWIGLPRLGVAKERAIIQGFCPLLVLEFAGEGHGDSLAVLMLVLAFCVRGKGAGLLAGAALACATAGKLMPIVLLPFLLRRRGSLRPDRRRAALVLAGFSVVLLAFYGPFFAPPLEMFRGTLEYAGRWRGNDSLFAVLHWLTERFLVADAGGSWLQEPQRLAKLPLVLLGCCVLARAWFRRFTFERAATSFFLFFIAFAPTLHPWYVAFLVPFLCIDPKAGFVLFTGTVFMAYHVLPGWITHHEWHERVWVKVLEYLPFYASLGKSVPGQESPLPPPSATPA